MSVIAFYGLRLSVYGLIVNIQNSDMFELDIKNIEKENLTKNRYLNIIGAHSFRDPVVLVDNEDYRPAYYIYALTGVADGTQDVDDSFKKSKVLIESKSEIDNWDEIEVSGLLKPYWYTIDSDVTSIFGSMGIEVTKDTEYLEMNARPWKWYWYLLIIFLAVLFYYRMIEAFLEKVKEVRTKSN